MQAFAGKRPALGANVFVAPSASVVGDVQLGAGSSVWYGAVVRGDVNSVRIGEKTSVQDNVLIHVAKHNAAGKVGAGRVFIQTTVVECGEGAGAWLAPALLPVLPHRPCPLPSAAAHGSELLCCSTLSPRAGPAHRHRQQRDDWPWCHHPRRHD